MSSKDYFNQVAGQWDEMRTAFFSEKVRETAFEKAAVQPGKLAADLGAGTGFITEGLLAHGLKVIAIDQSPVMLEQLQTKYGTGAAVETRLGESERLPMEDGAVDYVFSNMYLHHVEDPAVAIREMARITKPGGMVVISDLDTHEFTFLREEHHDRWMGFERPAVQGWLEAAGLSGARVDCSGEECCAESECGGDQARVSIFVASARKP